MTPTYTDLPGLARVEFRAMGTTVTVLLPTSYEREGGEAVQTLFADWERALSRFKPESELSQLNARAGEPVPVSPLLYHVLDMALQAAVATQGIYDPTLLAQIVAIGYSASFESLPADVAPSAPGTLGAPDAPDASPAAQVTPLPGDASALPLRANCVPGGAWRDIKLDPLTCTVTLPHGIGLDFGGIAKGMAVDAAIERLRQLGCAAAVVNAGGDLAVIGLPLELDAWPVAVPLRETWRTIPLARGALATSGIARRHWRQGGIERHHLLDPRTGQPANGGLWSVSVAAETCAQAEVAAKVAFILGPETGARFLSRHSLAGLLVREDGGTFGVGDWPEGHELATTTGAEAASGMPTGLAEGVR